MSITYTQDKYAHTPPTTDHLTNKTLRKAPQLEIIEFNKIFEGFFFFQQ